MTKRTTNLTSTCAVYVPAKYTELRERTLKVLGTLFGGATAQDCQGSYVMLSGELVIEPITRVFAYCAPRELAEGIDELWSLAEDIRIAAEQESVAIEIDGALYLVE